MSLFFNVSPAFFAQAVLAYLVSYSLRFDGSGDYLNRVVTASNRTTWTWSAWVKKNDLGARDYLFSGGAAGDYDDLFYLTWEDDANGTTRNNQLYAVWRTGDPNSTYNLGTSASYNDTSAWYHVVLSVDTTQSNSSDRMKIYIDGAEASYGLDNRSDIVSSGLSVNAAGNLCMGAFATNLTDTTVRFKGQMAEVHFVDGQALDPTYFGETRDGVWVPKEVTDIDYGNNGFYLDFKGNGTGVTLLLDGSSTIDKSSAGNNVTLTGATPNDQVTDQFGGTSGSFSFDGSGDYITVHNAAVDDWGTDDWTIEFWVKPTSTASRQILCGSTPSNGDTADSHLMIDLDSTGYWDVYVGDGTSWTQINGTIAATTEWQHVAAVRNGQTVSLFVDGAFGGSATVTHGVARGTATPFRIGRTGDYTLTDFAGYIADFRITRGYARYTDSFTPPTSALSADVSGITGSDDVVLLLDGSGGGNATVSDGSSINNTVTNVSSGVSNSNITGPYGTTQDVLSFDGVDDTLNFDVSTAMELDGDFTIETWIKRGNTAVDSSIFNYWGTSSDPRFNLRLDRTDGNVTFSYQDGATLHHRNFSYGTGSADGTTDWFHLALTRNGTSLRCFIDGVQIGTTQTISTATFTGSTTYSNKGYIGSLAGVENWFNGQIADVRITKGAALYPFHPPASALTNTHEYLGDFGVDRTTDGTGVILLLDGSGGGTSTITDNSSANNDMTNVSNGVSDSNITGPYGATQNVLSFDGTNGDYLTIPYNSTFSFGSEDFTIEMWMKRSTQGTRIWLMGQCDSGANNYSWIEINANNTIEFQDVNIGTFTSTGTISNTGWHHVALVRSSSTFTWFIDGTSSGTTTSSSSVYNNTTNNFSIGRLGDYAGGTNQNYNGQLTDIRITRGVARYSDTFTTPTSALTNDDTWDRPKNNFSVEGNIKPDDQLLDTPNLRFATWDPDTLTHASGNGDLTESNLKWVGTVGNDTVFASEAKSSGKWYYEAYINSTAAQAVLGWSTTAERDVTSPIVSAQAAYFITAGIRKTNTTVVWNSTTGNDGQSVTIANNDVFGFAIDISSGTLDIYRNGTLITSPALTLPSNKGTEFLPIIGDASSTDSTITANFGQDHTFAGQKSALLTPYSDANGVGEFYYQPPSGFLALATEYK